MAAAHALSIPSPALVPALVNDLSASFRISAMRALSCLLGSRYSILSKHNSALQQVWHPLAVTQRGIEIFLVERGHCRPRVYQRVEART